MYLEITSPRGDRYNSLVQSLEVRIPPDAYPIVIGPCARSRIAEIIADQNPHARIAVIADRQVADLHLAKLTDALDGEPAVLSFTPGEASKSIQTLELLFDGLAEAHIGRSDIIITFGGGVAGDLGGFAAASWLRGVRFIQVPTTIEAAVDASVGGKTAINHARGKNLVGAFHQPVGVFIDTDFLETLPARDYVAGLAESVKHAVIRDAAFLDWHERAADSVVRRDAETLEHLIARNCEIKAAVVERDEREAKLRMILNYGHTIGHALEHLFQYELRHGECVSLGMAAENAIAVGRGELSSDVAVRISALLERLGLPVRLPRPVSARDVAQACRMDKKARGGTVRFVLVRAIGEPWFVDDIRDDEISAALGHIQP